MEKNILSVREAGEKDVALIADYWYTAAPAYLESMGADPAKMPPREQLINALLAQIALPYLDKKTYALIWEADGEPIGHTNLNPVAFGKEGSMHLHIWKPETRHNGYGARLVQLSLPYYFDNLNLGRLLCEHYALNPAPAKTLQKAGFTYIKEYITNPGSITFEQPVMQWEFTRKKYLSAGSV